MGNRKERERKKETEREGERTILVIFQYSFYNNKQWQAAGMGFTIATKSSNSSPPQEANSASPSFRNKEIPQCGLMRWV
jgi:hypothetical protein